MEYYEFKILVADYNVMEEVQLMLSRMGYDSYVIEDKRDIIEIIQNKNKYEWDYYDENLLEDEDKKDDRAVITLYLDHNDNALSEIRSLSEKISEIQGTEIFYRLVDDSDWKDRWKAYFKPARVTDHIVIKPSWEEYEALEGDKIIEIDPGMAFGTGTHPTTKMCIQFLDDCIEPSDSVLDVGCGSGILSIAAALCGAGSVKGVDIDAEAVSVARDNLVKNGLGNDVEVFEGDVTEGLGIKADIIVANLMAELIVMIAPDIAAHLTGKSIFITSGIIVEKLEYVKSGLEAAGFNVIKVKEEDGWAAVLAQLKCS